MVRAKLDYNTPAIPEPCRFCGYPGTFVGCCTVCQSLSEAIEIMRTRSYWLRVEASSQARRRGL
jgi:hypothetical protein